MYAMSQSRRDRESQDNCPEIRARSMSTMIFLASLWIFGEVLALAEADRISGFYVDNGVDQTVVQKMPTHTIKREVAHELLNVLDLPDQPKKIERKSTMVKRPAPKFLMNIYTTYMYDPKYEPTDLKPERLVEFNLTNEDINAIDRSDVIMTFGAYNPHTSHEPKNNRGRRIWFDVSEVAAGTRILSAELRLYRKLLRDSTSRNASYTVSVFRVSRTANGEREKHYIASANIEAGHEGWMAFNITETFENWVNNSRNNKGLFIAAYEKGSKKRILRPDDIGIVGVNGTPDKEPFMVSYFANSGGRKKKTRKQRSAFKNEEKYSSLDIRRNIFVTDPVVQQDSEVCSVRTLYVSFKDLQWHDWVIAPEGFEANCCKGHCNFPLKTTATNHAILQTLVNLLKPEKKVPTPCCTPTKLSPMSVLYFLDDSNVVLKKYKNMIVDSCGCH